MAARADIGAVPKPITPGPEMEALARFHADVTWTGAIEEGGMGPGTPAMTAVGWGRHERIQDGRWIVGTYEQDQYLPDGTFVLKWQLHWVAGWDSASGEYRATIADNYGHADVMRGWIDGDRLTFKSIGDPPVRLRLVWDVSDPATMTWRNEMSVGGGPWSLVEEYRCTRSQEEQTGADPP
jgi:Protein of unknown function (DUF1579)